MSGGEQYSLPGNSFPRIPCATASTLPWYFLGHSKLSHGYRGEKFSSYILRHLQQDGCPVFWFIQSQDLFDRK